MFDIELIQQSGKNIATGEVQFFQNYQVVLNGERVGYIGWKPDSKLCPIRELGPIEKEAIENAIAEKMKRDLVETARLPPPIPEGLLDDEEGKLYDDFDS